MDTLYRVVRIDINTGAEVNYGGGNPLEDVKAITRGYVQDKALTNLYTRKNGKYIYIVDPET